MYDTTCKGGSTGLQFSSWMFGGEDPPGYVLWGSESEPRFHFHACLRNGPQRTPRNGSGSICVTPPARISALGRSSDVTVSVNLWRYLQMFDYKHQKTFVTNVRRVSCSMRPFIWSRASTSHECFSPCPAATFACLCSRNPTA